MTSNITRNTSFTQKWIGLIVSIVLLTVCLFSFSSYSKSYVYKWTNIKQVEITAYRLNVRTGPGTSYARIGVLSQGDIIDVVGTLGSWYVVHTDSDMIGLISSTYTRVYAYHDSGEVAKEDPTPNEDIYSYSITPEEQDMVDLINAERIKNGLNPYKVDMELMRVARIKAEDMSTMKYFSHTSPIYGTPFEMLTSFAIDYRSAGENIAGNSNVANAHTSLMNSSGHRANILNSGFDTIGIGIAEDSRYGKVFVQMFIKK